MVNVRDLDKNGRGDRIIDPYRANMATLYDLSIPYFYRHLPTINDLGALIPFNLFEVEVLVTINVAPCWIFPNDLSLINTFEVICQCVDVSPKIVPKVAR